MSLIKKAQLDFIPASTDCALLLLRLAFGLQMAFAHGWGKLTGYRNLLDTMWQDPIGVGKEFSLILAIFGELVCAILVAIGLLTRLAAVSCIVTMVVAFGIVHKWKLVGEGNGELAFLYLAAFLAIFLAGPGKYSVDAKLRGPG